MKINKCNEKKGNKNNNKMATTIRMRLKAVRKSGNDGF